VAVQHAQVTVGTAATELTAPDVDSVPGQSLMFTAPASPTLYLGGPGVTAADGVPVAVGQVVTATLGAGERLYAAVATGTVMLPVLRQGV
jgi:hypothetical protein